MTNIAATVPTEPAPRVRWNWLWSAREDLTWNLLPFWASLALGIFLLAWWQIAQLAHWDVRLPEAATQARITGIVMYLYGPLIDAPHLWATISRTYTDAAEWRERRRLFIGSLAWFIIGPVVILLPYALSAMSLFPAGSENMGWVLWSQFFTFYAIFHINKQHWGFISLYRRKNGEGTAELDVDRRFYQTAIWLPYAAWLTAPWYLDFDGAQLPLMQMAVGTTTLGNLLHATCHALFIGVCVAYIGFQILQWRRGVGRNGPKLLYLASVIPIYYLAFTFNPLLAAFWVLLTGPGHCAQYHKIVWEYGVKKYTAAQDEKRPSLPTRIFKSVWLYIVLGVGFGIVTLQGPGSGIARDLLAGNLQVGLLLALPFVSKAVAADVSLKIVAAFISGVRLHHFYVDSKIWRVSRNSALAKNLSV
jgi:hypothetical protein